MDLQTVIANLERTIHNKTVHLEIYKAGKAVGPKVVNDAMIQYLEINIGELQRILDDLKKIK
jgi:hypothetical protein